jgi:photosystem II stability/assembly factor-like uncharacterized protein
LKKITHVLILFHLILIAIVNKIYAQQSTIYAVTLSTGYGVTGMAMPLSAMFYKTFADTSWQYKGRPNNRIFGFDFYYPARGKIIALATHTGVHQSLDWGKSWKVTTGWRITEVNSVAFDPRNPDILYCSSPYGFYKTVDGGKNWVKYITGLNSIDAQFVSSFIIDHSNPDVIYCTTEDVVYQSADAGESWHKLGLRVKRIRSIAQHPTDANILAVATENNGFYFSLDGGKVWEKRDTGVMHSTFYRITFDPTNPDFVYAVGFQTGIYKSVDGGEKWNHYFKGLDALDFRTIAVDPNNGSRLIAGSIGKGVYQSEDGGASWRFIGIPDGYVGAVKILDF